MPVSLGQELSTALLLERRNTKEIEGGVHVDGFLRGVKRRVGWRAGDTGERKKRWDSGEKETERAGNGKINGKEKEEILPASRDEDRADDESIRARRPPLRSTLSRFVPPKRVRPQKICGMCTCVE